MPKPEETTPARARIPLTMPNTLIGRLAGWYSRRTYGKVMQPVAAMAHNTAVLKADALFEKRVEKFNTLAPNHKQLAELVTAMDIGCQWCVDFGYFLSQKKNTLSEAQLTALPRWQTADEFSETEKLVIQYAHASTATPPAVDDELVAKLRSAIGDAALVELTFMIGVENLRSRFNAAMGLESQGFSEACRVQP